MNIIFCISLPDHVFQTLPMHHPAIFVSMQVFEVTTPFLATYQEVESNGHTLYRNVSVPKKNIEKKATEIILYIL